MRTVVEGAQRLADPDMGISHKLVAGVCRKGVPRGLGSQWASHSGVAWKIVNGDVYRTPIKFEHV